MPGRSPARNAARRAVKAAFAERDIFMADCLATHPLAHCTAQAEMHILNGFALVTTE